MTGYKLNTNFNVHSDEFFDLCVEAKLLWLYLFHEFDPCNDDELVIYDPKAIERSLNAFDIRAVEQLLSVHALIALVPVTNCSVPEALHCNGGVTRE